MGMHPAWQSFRDWLRAEYRPDGSYERIEVLEGSDAPSGTYAVRLVVAKRSYYEVRADAERSELQAGFATESRTVNEAIEQSVLDNGGDLNELLGDELCDLGEEPLPVEHFWDRPAFRYVVRLRPDRPEELESPALRKRVKAILRACHILFQECVDEG
jgi:hypothetical protein